MTFVPNPARATLAAAVLLCATVPGWAQDGAGLGSDPFAECDCVASQTGTDAAGQILFTEGNVLVLTDTGFQDGVAGFVIGPDGEVMTGTDSRADVAVSRECIGQLRGNQVLRLSTPAGPGGDICMRIDNTGQQLAGVGEAGAAAGNPTLAAVAGLGAAIGIGTLVVLGLGEDQASP